jgi:hypothetical protein
VMPTPFQRSLLPRLLIAAAARRATLLAVVAHLHRGNVNDRRVLPTFPTRLPREHSLIAGLRVGHVYSPFCAGFSNRSINRWTSDSFRPTPPFFIGVAQRVPSRAKRRSVERGMPNRLAAWPKVKILSAGSVVSGGGKLLPLRRRVVPAGLGPARQPDSLPAHPLCWALCYGKASRPLPCFGMVLGLKELRSCLGPVHRLRDLVSQNAPQCFANAQPRTAPRTAPLPQTVA